jgi:formate dehydrogenase major subunit
MSTITVNGSIRDVRSGDRLIDIINAAGIELPQVCYHAQVSLC